MNESIIIKNVKNVSSVIAVLSFISNNSFAPLLISALVLSTPPVIFGDDIILYNILNV